jgi:hypothetical protein
VHIRLEQFTCICVTGSIKTEEAVEKATPGIHHITAIAGEPQPNLDFYTGLSGLRLGRRPPEVR